MIIIMRKEGSIIKHGRGVLTDFLHIFNDFLHIGRSRNLRFPIVQLRAPLTETPRYHPHHCDLPGSHGSRGGGGPNWAHDPEK